jgi:hypothetical protein
MKTKASVLTLRIPLELKHKIEQIADQQGVSINRGKDKKLVSANFDNVMAKIKEREIPEWDGVL